MCFHLGLYCFVLNTLLRSSPSLCQVTDVAALPGTVGSSLAVPDVHSYGFRVRNAAAFDTEDPLAEISPEGAWFGMNCRREDMLEAIVKNTRLGVIVEIFRATRKNYVFCEQVWHKLGN